MAVSLYFGLPGAGKTTMMVYLALKGIKSQRYRYIYCNVHIAVPGVTYIDNECIGKYDLSDCLILVDEATLFADSRDFKNFGKDKLTYFLEHRHYNADIILFTQQWDGVDRKIRVITDRVFYVYKGKILGRWFTRCYPIPYGIIIPDPKKTVLRSSVRLSRAMQSLMSLFACSLHGFIVLAITSILIPGSVQCFRLSLHVTTLPPSPKKRKKIFSQKEGPRPKPIRTLAPV